MLGDLTAGMGNGAIAPLLVFLAVAALGINAAVFVGRRVPNHLVAYPLAMLVGMGMFVLAAVMMVATQSYSLMSA